MDQIGVSNICLSKCWLKSVEAVADASSKIKAAVDLKPNLGKLLGTENTSFYVCTSATCPLRSEKYAASVENDLQTTLTGLEAIDFFVGHYWLIYIVHSKRIDGMVI